MLEMRATGQGAASRKYDLLTAMGALALTDRGSEERLILRLMTPITARYNRIANLLATAQATDPDIRALRLTSAD